MIGDDGFLSRWAKRKEEVRKEQLAAPEPVSAPEPTAVPEEPAFDLSSLPSIDSLTASSDITMFLQKGVPSALRNAALRMAWVSDPAIRDYIGPADFQWDFNMPGAITGYGELAAGTDVAAMVSDVTESHLKKLVEVVTDPTGDAPSAAAVSRNESIAAEIVPLEEAAPVGVISDDPEAPQIPLPMPRRRHGGATPR